MKRAIVTTIIGFMGISFLSCDEETENCDFRTMKALSSECGFEEICDIQSQKDGFKVNLTHAACVPNSGQKDPGASCKKDSQCKNGLCMDGTCVKVCFDQGVKCAKSQQCVISGWIKTQGAEHRVGYCAEKAACIAGEETCDEGDECRYLIGNRGVPNGGGSFAMGCTPVLGDKSEGDDCDFSDECAPGLICAAIPNLEDSEQVCRKACEFSASCGDSTVGDWCSTDLEGNQAFQFEIDGSAVGVCTEDPNAPAGETDTDTSDS